MVGFILLCVLEVSPGEQFSTIFVEGRLFEFRLTPPTIPCPLAQELSIGEVLYFFATLGNALDLI